MCGRVACLVEIVEKIAIAIEVGVGMSTDFFQLFLSIRSQGTGRSVGYRLVAKLGKLVGIEELRQLGSFLKVVLTTIVDAQLLVALSTLGLNKDNTISGTCTIDGSSGSILQYGDALDVIGVEVRKTSLTIRSSRTESWHTIDNEQRC